MTQALICASNVLEGLRWPGRLNNNTRHSCKILVLATDAVWHTYYITPLGKELSLPLCSEICIRSTSQFQALLSKTTCDDQNVVEFLRPFMDCFEWRRVRNDDELAFKMCCGRCDFNTDVLFIPNGVTLRKTNLKYGLKCGFCSQCAAILTTNDIAKKESAEHRLALPLGSTSVTIPLHASYQIPSCDFQYIGCNSDIASWAAFTVFGIDDHKCCISCLFEHDHKRQEHFWQASHSGLLLSSLTLCEDLISIVESYLTYNPINNLNPWRAIARSNSTAKSRGGSS
jgi:hypothetical protein